MRTKKYVGITSEIKLCELMSHQLLNANISAQNTVIVTVSTDYSSMVGQYLRHALSWDKEICDGFGIDVPYPDELWTSDYIIDLHETFKTHNRLLKDKTLLLVEAGVINGRNYTYVTDFIRKSYDNRIVTLALFENHTSVFKSDFVGEYYNDSVEDLTFWWERDNKHWPAYDLN